MGLQDWWADRFDSWFMNQLAGNTAQTDTKYTGNNTVSAVAATRTISASGNDAFTLSLVDQAVTKARTLSPVIRPIQTEAGEKYVLFITPEAHYDLRRSTATLEWGDIQKAAMQGGNISDNPIFTGALGEYNGVILHESFRVPITSNVGENILCGAQAGHFAFGRDNGPNRMSWTEELFDYGNQLGVSAGCIAGMKRTIYNSLDFSVVKVRATHSTAAQGASGR